PSRDQLRSSRRRGNERKLDAERRPGSRFALDVDAAAVRLDDRTRDVEAQPGPGNVLVACGGRAEEPIEQSLELVRCDSDSRVLHLNAHGLSAARDANLDAAAFGRELDRV